MKAYLFAYLATALVFLGLDAIWLSVAVRFLYRPILGELLLDTFNLVPAAAFYLLYVAGIVTFAVSPAFVTSRPTTALVYGALFGFFAYATYDLTNQATLRGWSSLITIADIGWGTLLTAVAATLGYLIASAALRLVDG
jgi:uncharacterized membrane protein